MTRRAVAAPLVAAVALLAGCGDDDPAGGSGTTATVAPGDAAFCDAFGALIAGPLTDAGTDFQDPEQLRAAVEETDELLSAVVASSPAEVAISARALADEYAAGFAVLERYGYDFARVEAEATPDDAAVLDSFLEAPVGPGAPDPIVELEGVFLDRCAPGVTVPADLLTTTTAPTSP